MGNQLSAPVSSSPPNSPQQQNPKTSSTTITSSAPETLETENLNQEQETQNQEQETQNQEEQTQNQEQETQNQEQQIQIQEEEEEGECGLCLYIKKGACKKAFVNLEKYCEEGEKNNEDYVEMCYEARLAWRKCMEANQEYYGELLQATKYFEQLAINQLKQEKQKEKEGVIVDGTNQEKDNDKQVVADQER